MEMSSVIEDVEDITLETFSEMLRSGLDGLYEIVDARPGDKTLVDTLYPVANMSVKQQMPKRIFLQHWRR